MGADLQAALLDDLTLRSNLNVILGFTSLLCSCIIQIPDGLVVVTGQNDRRVTKDW